MIAKNKKHKERTGTKAERVTKEIEQRDKNHRKQDAFITISGVSISNVRTELRKEGNKVIQEKFSEPTNIISRLTRSAKCPGQGRKLTRATTVKFQNDGSIVPTSMEKKHRAYK